MTDTQMPAQNVVAKWPTWAPYLLSALRMFDLTGDARYLDVFRKTWRFVRDEIVDRGAGEWRPSVPAGSLPADKAQPWKEGYHNGRAMIECLKLLSSLIRSSDAGA